ncbi:hypothetical protein [Brachyspira hampsonii]|uniref:Uncharacterized protein n=1 Tax=Brachyspira hampsonii TaxID=1287055 RepID=A0AAC9XKB3_9SPIR|nr:hypothetical protein [Brachyspira hampsonii]ASJ21495.1 hypothetical protein BHAMNSH16_07525 [Brachyspira hampsonii]ELV06132.1 hypothetical protein H263_06142 [Brachyspira hampsonii 30599]MBW5411090.1 hypothetical protein [Brachyspira hampsonii]OEJ18003.1 hypothetical protein A9496_09360 [Brachyspira hampsonii]
MSDFAIIVICISSIVIAYFVFNIIKSGRHANMKADVKNGTIEFGNNTDNEKNKEKIKEEKYIQKQNNIINNAFESPKELPTLTNKNNDDIINYYNSSNFKYDDKITSLTVYKEYSNIISQSTLEVQSIIISYIAKNHILNKNKTEFESYLKQKRIEIIDIYNTALFNSSIESIKKLQLENICNFYYMIILDNIKDTYKSIYDNHKEQALKRKDFLKNLKNIKPQDRLKSYDVFIHNNFTETAIRDSEIVLDNLKHLQKFLLGIFHDNLKYNGVI